jgi:hypothetical protein
MKHLGKINHLMMLAVTAPERLDVMVCYYGHHQCLNVRVNLDADYEDAEAQCNLLDEVLAMSDDNAVAELDRITRRVLDLCESVRAERAGEQTKQTPPERGCALTKARSSNDSINVDPLHFRPAGSGLTKNQTLYERPDNKHKKTPLERGNTRSSPSLESIGQVQCRPGSEVAPVEGSV